jgi:hypothetical protein
MSDSAALKNLLAHAGALNPADGKPMSEALCFGLAGGIGAGYSFCPSVPRSGHGSGVSIPGRYRAYATDATWFQGCFDRLGIATRVTETTAPGKAYRNLKSELEEGRPTVVWCGRANLPILGGPIDSCDMGMYTLIVHAIDETAAVAQVADRAPTSLTLSLEQLALARNQVCSHKNRTLTIDPNVQITVPTLRRALKASIRETAEGLLAGKMKTFSLEGLEILAKMIVNRSNKDGWLKVFHGRLLYQALRDLYESIETGDGGGLHRGLYADFLSEAGPILGNDRLTQLATIYAALSDQWRTLARLSLPGNVKIFKEARDLLAKRDRLFLEKGARALDDVKEVVKQLQAIQTEMSEFPLSSKGTELVLQGLRDQIVDLHQAETAAARELQSAC